MLQLTLGRFSFVVDGRYASLTLGSRSIECAVESMPADAPLFGRALVQRRAGRRSRRAVVGYTSLDVVLFRRQLLIDLGRQRTRQVRAPGIATA